MNVEKYDGIVRIHKTSPNGKISDKFDDKKDVPLVRFDSHKRPFLMLTTYCDNPECDCSDVTLSFTEIDEPGCPPISKPIYFSLRLDVRTWQEKRIPGRSKVIQRLVDEFIDNLTDEIKIRFKEHYDLKKENALNASKFKMPIDEINKGALVSYSDVFGKTGSVLSGGNGFGFGFEYEGGNYIIVDLYCINPRCKCKSIHLVFMDCNKEKSVLSDLFTGILSFKNAFKIENNPGCTKKEAKNIFKYWKAGDPGAIDILKNRYKRMKKIGQGLVAKK